MNIKLANSYLENYFLKSFKNKIMNVKQIVIAFFTLLSKEVKRVLRIWPQTLIPPLITTSLYFIIFGGILFRDQIISISGYKIEYILYLFPGLIMMSVITNAYSSPVSSLFATKIFQNIEELIISPSPTWVIILGFAFGSIFRAMLNAIMIYVVSRAFLVVWPFDWLITIVMLFLSALFFSLAGIINAIFAKTFDDISWFPAFILTPMVYLGGVFFGIDVLPHFWQKVSLFNPVYYFINLFRYAILGIGLFDIRVFIAIIGGNIVLFILAIFFFDKKIKR